MPRSGPAATYRVCIARPSVVKVLRGQPRGQETMFDQRKETAPGIDDLTFGALRQTVAEFDVSSGSWANSGTVDGEVPLGDLYRLVDAGMAAAGRSWADGRVGKDAACDGLRANGIASMTFTVRPLAVGCTLDVERATPLMAALVWDLLRPVEPIGDTHVVQSICDECLIRAAVRRSRRAAGDVASGRMADMAKQVDEGRRVAPDLGAQSSPGLVPRSGQESELTEHDREVLRRQFEARSRRQKEKKVDQPAEEAAETSPTDVPDPANQQAARTKRPYSFREERNVESEKRDAEVQQRTRGVRDAVLPRVLQVVHEERTLQSFADFVSSLEGHEFVVPEVASEVVTDINALAELHQVTLTYKGTPCYLVHKGDCRIVCRDRPDGNDVFRGRKMPKLGVEPKPRI